jgi:hypothetical protein
MRKLFQAHHWPILPDIVNLPGVAVWNQTGYGMEPIWFISEPVFKLWPWRKLLLSSSLNPTKNLQDANISYWTSCVEANMRITLYPNHFQIMQMIRYKGIIFSSSLTRCNSQLNRLWWNVTKVYRKDTETSVPKLKPSVICSTDKNNFLNYLKLVTDLRPRKNLDVWTGSICIVTKPVSSYDNETLQRKYLKILTVTFSAQQNLRNVTISNEKWNGCV